MDRYVVSVRCRNGRFRLPRLLRLIAAAFIIGLDATADPPRVMHHFDFDERPQGNLESIPKYWRSLRPSGFPRFSVGLLDDSVGRNAPPSFRLNGYGRNVAYAYVGSDTVIGHSGEYQVEAFIRPDRLVHARACISACFLDDHGDPLLTTLVRSRYVGGPDDPDDWIRVELLLSSVSDEARSIGIIVWLLQDATWRNVGDGARHIARPDISAGAWFDDITITSRPSVKLAVTSPGNVLVRQGKESRRAEHHAGGNTIGLTVHGYEHIDNAYRGQVVVVDADGAEIESHSIPDAFELSGENRLISLEHLQPGWYQARLTLTAPDVPALERRIGFVVVAPAARSQPSAARSFGVALDSDHRADSESEVRLLQGLVARSIKYPLPISDFEDPTGADRRQTERILGELRRSGFFLTGVVQDNSMMGPSDSTRADRDMHGSDILSGRVMDSGAHSSPISSPESSGGSTETSAVRTTEGATIASLVTPLAGIVNVWQIGPDLAVDGGISSEKLTVRANRFREIVRPLVSSPSLAASWSSREEPPVPPLPVEWISLVLGPEASPESIPSYINGFRDPAYRSLSAIIDAPGAHFSRMNRLAHFARRVISARHAGVDTVFIPQPWRIHDTPLGRLIEPTEEYVLYRTLAETLSDFDPGQTLDLRPGVRCLAFHRGSSSVLAVWDDRAPSTGSLLRVQLGRNCEIIDLWGNVRKPEPTESGEQRIPVSPVPILLTDVERWLVELRESISLEPRLIESGNEANRLTLKMGYAGAHPVTGKVSFHVPASWKVNPLQSSFQLNSIGPLEIPIDVSFPYTEPAGRREFSARIQFDGDPGFMEIPLAVEIGLFNIEVTASAFVDHGRLILRHVVTNRSPDILHFRGSATVPGRQRQQRPITNLVPGDTQTLEYQFDHGEQLIGSSAYLSLRSLSDGSRTHTLELTIP